MNVEKWNTSMQKVRVVIQVRMSSSRLPAKALLPICGLPSVILCALRASNSGLHVLVATSYDSFDDILCDTLKTFNIPFVRGPLQDVLSRYVFAVQDLFDDDIVVRLTADNVFPDGSFIEELVSAFYENKSNYMGTNSPIDGLPYGLSAEIFTVGFLRQAEKNTSSDFDRENVTPWIKSHFQTNIFRPKKISYDMSHLRCTLDTFDDYVRLNKVFAGIDDPVYVSYDVLCSKLSRLKDAPLSRVPFSVKGGTLSSSMTLGTAQLGMKYGRTNLIGKPEEEQAINIIKEAIKHGVISIDTARDYGESELCIGEALKYGLARQATVITKLSIPKIDQDKIINKDLCNAMVDASIFRSCRELQVSNLNVVLLHNWQHYYSFDQAFWKRLLFLKNEGVIRSIGASVYTPQDAINALNDSNIKYLQIPFNILDWRWLSFDFLKKVEMRPDVIIHARSVFLQGILCADKGFWPAMRNVDACEIIKKINDLVCKFKRLSRADLCIAYARSKSWIDSVIVGIDSIEHLYENILLFNQPILTQDQCAEVEMCFKDIPERFLNPSNWVENEKYL